MRAVSFLNQALELAFPQHCLVCDRRTRWVNLCSFCCPVVDRAGYENRCLRCFSLTTSWASAHTPRLDASGVCEVCQCFPMPFRQLRYLWRYEGRARALINVIKYRPSPTLAKTAGLLLAERLRELFPLPDWDLLVPVPASRESFCRRTFNQCATIAKILLTQCAFPEQAPHLELRALLHLGSNAPQASLEHKRRIGNVRKSFKANKQKVSGKRILLIDDVITSGATSAAAAHALHEAGAMTVDLLALARAPAWSEFRVEIYQRLRPGRVE